ncbi:MAG TPA: cation:proton antiporter [Smithellaceae bacterium]|nr:cation:proton antiporter [Smithellaceae bacterium]HRY38543.1 cation:proton antiporter [Smithellaceae bacterium]
MNGLNFFHQLIIILGFSIPVIYIFNKIKLPSIIGFLITGIIIGPFGLKLIQDIDGIQLMAEIGVAFLLFTIGIEIRLSRFLKHLSEILLTGGLQILCTFIVGMIIGLTIQLSISQSIFIGFILVHSSSALILKILKDRDDEASPQGRISIGVILFQDMMVVPMMLLIPFLARESGPDALMIAWKLVKSILIIVVILVAARYVIPRVLERLVNTNMRDVLVIASVVITMGIAGITESLGLSLAIGAFLAGLALSDTDFTHQITSNISPFRDVFLSVFFVAFGMILNLDFLRENPGYIILISLIIIGIKATIVFGLVKLLKYPLRVALLSGVLLSQIGEFSFVLASQGFKNNIISNNIYQTFIGASVLTFIVTPLLASLVYYLLARKNIFDPTQRTVKPDERVAVSNHVIICGMGLNGRNLVRVLKDTAINYVIIDLNFQKIKKSKSKGDKNTIWGDASSIEILRRANVEAARVMVIAISDRYLTKSCLSNAKAIHPNLHVIVRTKYVADIEDLLALGADDVIPEEFETSIQIFSRVLKMFHIPNSIILAQSNIIRNKSYGVFREIRYTQEAFDQISQILAQGTIETYYIGARNPIIGRSIRDINLKAKSGAMIINIIRNNQTITNPPSDFVLQAADQLILFGSHDAIDLGLKILDGNNHDDAST